MYYYFSKNGFLLNQHKISITQDKKTKSLVVIGVREETSVCLIDKILNKIKAIAVQKTTIILSNFAIYRLLLSFRTISG
jgi:hypothetical protein